MEGISEYESAADLCSDPGHVFVCQTIETLPASTQVQDASATHLLCLLSWKLHLAYFYSS